MLSLGDLMAKRNLAQKAASKKQTVLPERFMQDARETYDMFEVKDLPYMAYFRLFQRNTARREELIRIRTWVRSHGNRGRIFFSLCKKNNLS